MNYTESHPRTVSTTFLVQCSVGLYKNDCHIPRGGYVNCIRGFGLVLDLFIPRLQPQEITITLNSFCLAVSGSPLNQLQLLVNSFWTVGLLLHSICGLEAPSSDPICRSPDCPLTD
jgi:hypothetical protein